MNKITIEEILKKVKQGDKKTLLIIAGVLFGIALLSKLLSAISSVLIFASFGIIIYLGVKKYQEKNPSKKEELTEDKK